MTEPIFNTDAAIILNSMMVQITGAESVEPVDEASFVSLATTALKTGYDSLSTAMSIVLSDTRFSTRPYQAKLRILERDAQQYGNHTRKVTPIDRYAEQDDRFTYEDGDSADMYEIRKPRVLQTNLYGGQPYKRHYTIFKDQWDMALTGSEQFAQFVAMVVQNEADIIEQEHEAAKRILINGFIGGKYFSDKNNVVYLIDEYNKATGAGVTAANVKSNENFPAFAKWFAGYLKTLCGFMSERSYKYHMNFEDSDGEKINIARHTPLSSLKVLLNNGHLNAVETQVYTDIFHEDYLKVVDVEGINYWQSIDEPMKINVKPDYNKANGEAVENPRTFVADNVLGILFDEEAMGITKINEWSATTPFNADGGYYNEYMHWNTRYWKDYTENAVVLILDTNPANYDTFTTTAGTSSGDTKITPKASGANIRYFYALNTGVADVEIGDDMTDSDFTEITGPSILTGVNVTAGDNTHGTVVYADSNGIAMVWGTKPLVIKE